MLMCRSRKNATMSASWRSIRRAWTPSLRLGVTSILMLCVCSPVRAQLYQIDHYTSREGLAHGAIFDIHQDQQGYIWIGTYGGLSRYNGQRFDLVTTDHNVELGQVRKIFETRSGDFWFCTSTGAYRLRGSDWLRFTDPTVEPNTFLCGLEGRDGTIWLGTYGAGVFALKDGETKHYGVHDGLAHDTVWCMFEDRQGQLWFGTRGGGISLFDGASFSTIDRTSGLSDNSVFCLAQRADGTVIAGTGEGGLNLLHDNEISLLNVADGLASDNIGAYIAARNGDEWIGTFGGGIQSIAAKPYFRVQERNGLASDYVTCMMEDYEGNIWIGTYGSGVSKYVGRRFENYSKDNGLSSGFVTAVSQDKDGAMWFGTRGGGLTRLANDRMSYIDQKSGLSSNIIRCLLHDSLGRFWVGTNQGLNLIENGDVVTFGESDGIQGIYINAVVEDPAGQVWVATNHRNGLGVFAYQGDGFKALTSDLDVPPWFVKDMFWDPSGTLWMCANFFLMAYDGEEFELFDQDDGYPRGEVTGLLVKDDGTVWVSSSVGLIRFKDQQFTTFTVADGLPSNNLFSLVTANQQLWIGSNRGIARFDGTHFVNYDHHDGLVGDETLWNSSFVDRNGNLWFGTSTGVSKYDPKFDQPNTAPPRVDIEQVTVNGTIYDAQQPLALRHGENEIEIQFAALSFTAEQEVRYRYRLKGLQEAWSDELSKPYARFERLPPGQYHFEVTAKNNDTTWSDHPASLSFQIAKPLWLTRWFMGLVALILAAGFVQLGFMGNRFKQRRHRRQEMARLLKRYHELFETAPDLYCSLDEDGSILDCNQAVTWMLGYQKSEVLGKKASDFVVEDDRNRLLDAFANLFAHDRAIDNLEIRAADKANNTVWLSLNSNLVRDENGLPIMSHTIARDITNRKRSEESLQQSQRLESLGLLAGGVAHDFNNLLSAILGHAEIATRQAPKVPELQQHLHHIQTSCLRAADLTRQMLAYAGKDTFIHESVDLNQLIIETLELLQLGMHKGIRLNTRLAAELPHITADRGQILQVVMNLVTNASESIPRSGGQVTVETRVVDCVEGINPIFSNINPSAQGSLVQLTVTDNGCGIPEPEIKRIFEPFYSTKFVGRGLGLAAVIGIVKTHHGAIEVQSSERSGTTFSVYFPQAETRPPETLIEPETMGDCFTILVVEDEPSVREMVEAVLQHHGHRVILANDGQQAIDLYRAHRDQIDLLLLDVTLPLMNGDEALEIIRQDDPEVRAILTSGYGQSEAMAKFAECSLTWFIHKPYRQAELIQLIAAVVSPV